jgi:hypothetical protein
MSEPKHGGQPPRNIIRPEDRTVPSTPAPRNIPMNSTVMTSTGSKMTPSTTNPTEKKETNHV